MSRIDTDMPGTHPWVSPVVLAGPSGAGKTTLARSLALCSRFEEVVTVTTRLPRAGEREGVDYRFISQDEFDRMAGAGELLECVRGVHGNCYGTPEDAILAPMTERIASPVLVLSPEGMRSVRERFPDTKTVFIDVPDPELERRLVERGTRGADLERRMADAEAFRTTKDEFDAVIENRDLAQAKRDLSRALGMDARAIEVCERYLPHRDGPWVSARPGQVMEPLRDEEDRRAWLCANVRYMEPVTQHQSDKDQGGYHYNLARIDLVVNTREHDDAGHGWWPPTTITLANPYSSRFDTGRGNPALFVTRSEGFGSHGCFPLYALSSIPMDELDGCPFGNLDTVSWYIGHQNGVGRKPDHSMPVWSSQATEPEPEAGTHLTIEDLLRKIDGVREKESERRTLQEPGR